LPAEHLPVVPFGVLHRDGVALGVEQLILGEQAVPFRVLVGVPLQVDELFDHLLLT